MNAYLFAKAIHIIAAIGLIGPLFLAPRWLALSREAAGQRVLNDLHVQTALSGWGVLISGVVILYVQNGGLLSSLWMQLCIALYLFVQIFDHFWADKREEELASGSSNALQSLRIWLVSKVAIYTVISFAMVLKPLS